VFCMILEKTSNFALQDIKRLVFITEVESIFIVAPCILKIHQLLRPTNALICIVFILKHVLVQLLVLIIGGSRWRVFTARYGLSPYITQIRLVFKGLKSMIFSLPVDRPSAYHWGLNRMAVLKCSVIVADTKM
jgi:hypothetical protein